MASTDSLSAFEPDKTLADRGATRRSLTYFNWNLLLRAVFDTVCAPTSFLFVAFVLSLGIPEENMGRLTAVASLACLMQILILPLVTRAQGRKKFIFTVGLIEPLLLVATVLLVPLLPPPARLLTLTVAVFTTASFLHMTRPVMDDWLASTIPGTLRGRYLGRRIQMLGAVTIASVLTAGWLGDWAPRQTPHGLSWVLAAGAAFGVFAMIAIVRIRDIRSDAGAPVRLVDVPKALKVRPFRLFVLGYLIYDLPFFLAVPFYQVFNQRVLGLTNRRIAWMLVGYCLLKLVCSRSMGRAVDRLGARKMSFLVGPVYVAFFLLLALATASHPWPAYAAWFVAGFADATFGVCYQSELFGVVPEQRGRPTFFAIANLITLGLYAVGGVLAEGIIHGLAGARVVLGCFVLERYQLLFAGCGVTMVASTFGILLWPTKQQRVRPQRREGE